MDKNLLTTIMWILFVGGLFAAYIGVSMYFRGANAADYNGSGLAAGIWLVGAALTAYLKNKLA
jgi:hypothetical protein